MVLQPDDLHGVPLRWFDDASGEFEQNFSDLMELLNTDRPESLDDIRDVHAEFLSYAGPFIAEFPEGVTLPVDTWREGGEMWPWTGHEEERHEEVPAYIYGAYRDLREAADLAAYQENWDDILVYMEAFNEFL